MRYLTIALLFVLPVGVDAEQRGNRARANTERMLDRAEEARSNDQRSRSPRAEALSRSPEEVRLPAGSRTRAQQQRIEGNLDRDHFTRWPQTHRPQLRDRAFRHRMPFGSFYAVPYTGYGYGAYAPAPEAEDYSPREVHTTTTATTGVLRLEVTPAYGLDYYVDGVFIGSSGNIGTAFELNAGARRVEVRAAGHKSLAFDTRITEGRETTFRGALEPLTQTQPVQATGSRTMYIVPGCYFGNTPPTAATLRQGCDINRLITR